ncbi:hypothetical protein BC937DRAFT_93489 [Endogone sp. FLAS-F59071]|nr:hypothetical protein BC937DRAFT_93489 [Endogone sp. FLAS-F59071]|eukprot:RUS14677.1 hypothetical protein BC937DRAFT_93489 [Endogone sp. FLAS-F59071]
MGASGSLLMATMVLESFMPAKCWIAPEIPGREGEGQEEEINKTFQPTARVKHTRRDNLARLANLQRVVNVTGINRGTGGANCVHEKMKE